MKMRIWAALLTVYLVWGSTYLAIRFAVESIPPFLMAAARFLAAGAILYAWRRLAGDTPARRIEWRSAAIVGLFLLLGGNGGVVWAEQYIPSGITALIIGSTPLWIVLIDALRPGGVRPGWMTVAGVLIGFGGILLLVLPGLNGASEVHLAPAGVLALLLATLFWAIGSLYSRNASLPKSPLLGTGMEMLAGGAGLLLVGTLSGEWARLDLAAISARSWWAWLYLVFVGALLGFAAYTWLLRVAPTPLAATYAYVNPLVAILLGSLLASEPITPRILLAALVIVGSVVLINTSRMQAPQAQTAPATGED